VRSLTSWRTRPAAETLLLIAIAVCLAIAVVRVGAVMVAVPAAASAAAATGDSVSSHVVKTEAWKSWWGGRVIPFREGGDYLGVMWHWTPTRTVGSVIGVIVERDRALGVRIDRVLVPVDETALYGRPPGAQFTRPDGTTFRTQWANIGRYSRYFTDVPVDQADYAPSLSAAAYADLASRTKLTERCRAFYTADPVPGGSGTWVLYSRQGEEREYLLVPQELVTAGGAS